MTITKKTCLKSNKSSRKNSRKSLKCNNKISKSNNTKKIIPKIKKNKFQKFYKSQKHYKPFGKGKFLKKKGKILVNINKKGFWEGLEAKSQHCYDSKLANQLLEFIKKENIKNIADFGCGMGKYVKFFKENNIDATGFDGNPNTPKLTNNLCTVQDLSIPIKFEEPFEWVLSLEVGEHIPKKYEDIFINNLHNNNKNGMILSWAIKGQGGHGHINEQNNDYIKKKISKLGYINDVKAENILRKNSTFFWFRNTIMVFRKKK